MGMQWCVLLILVEAATFAVLGCLHNLSIFRDFQGYQIFLYQRLKLFRNLKGILMMDFSKIFLQRLEEIHRQEIYRRWNCIANGYALPKGLRGKQNSFVKLTTPFPPCHAEAMTCVLSDPTWKAGFFGSLIGGHRDIFSRRFCQHLHEMYWFSDDTVARPFWTRIVYWHEIWQGVCTMYTLILGDIMSLRLNWAGSMVVFFGDHSKKLWHRQSPRENAMFVSAEEEIINENHIAARIIHHHH